MDERRGCRTGHLGERTSGSAGAATGVIDLGPAGPDASDIGVSYNGEIQFIQITGAAAAVPTTGPETPVPA